MRLCFRFRIIPSTPCVDAEYAEERLGISIDGRRYIPLGARRRIERASDRRTGDVGVFRKCFGSALATRRGVKEISQEPACEFLHYPKEKYSVKRDCEGDAANSVGCRYHGLFSMDAVDDKSQYEWDSLIPKAVWRGAITSF